MMDGLEGFIGVNGPKVVQQLTDATEKTINDGFDKLIGQLGGATAPPHGGGGGGGQIAGLGGMGSPPTRPCRSPPAAVPSPSPRRCKGCGP